jgi:anti-sigma B factor antagonist
MHAEPSPIAPVPAAGAPTTTGRGSLRTAVATRAGEIVVTVAGDLDLLAADAFEREVRRVAAAGGRLLIDLRAVEFLDSGGLRALLMLRNDAKRNRRELALVPGPAVVQRVFLLSGTRGLFDWREVPSQ